MYWFTGLLGVVLAGAPFVFGYSSDFYAMATSLGVGGLLVALSAIEGIAEDKGRWEYWLAGVLGAGLVLAPFVLGFSTIAAAMWMSIIVGIVTVVLAGMKLFSGDSPNYG